MFARQKALAGPIKFCALGREVNGMSSIFRASGSESKEFRHSRKHGQSTNRCIEAQIRLVMRTFFARGSLSFAESGSSGIRAM